MGASKINLNIKNIGTDLIIRQSEASDLGEILQLYSQLHPKETFDELSSSIQKTWQEINQDNRLFCFVAVIDGTVASTCVLDIIPNLTRGARSFAVLQNVVTDKNFRGLGVGAQLNQYAIDFAWAKGCYQVLVQTGREEVVGFYEKLGFKKDKIGLLIKPEWGKSES